MKEGMKDHDTWSQKYNSHFISRKGLKLTVSERTRERERERGGGDEGQTEDYAILTLNSLTTLCFHIESLTSSRIKSSQPGVTVCYCPT